MAAITESTWTATTAIAKGDYITPTTPGAYWYRANNAGTTSGAGSEPVWGTTIGGSTVDNDITFICVGIFPLVPDFTFSQSLRANTIITKLGGGAEERKSGWSSLLFSFDCTFVNRVDADFTSLKTFFTNNEGMYRSFAFLNPDDSAYYLVVFADDTFTGEKSTPAAVKSFSCGLREVVA